MTLSAALGGLSRADMNSEDGSKNIHVVQPHASPESHGSGWIVVWGSSATANLAGDLPRSLKEAEKSPLFCTMPFVASGFVCSHSATTLTFTVKVPAFE